MALRRSGFRACFILLFLIPCTSLWAQLCDGNLGDPIVNITFGSDATPPRAPKGITPFKQGFGCPKPGSYSLANLIFGCGENNSWNLLVGDHTQDVGGKYMVVNAENTSGTIYHDTLSGLCGNTPYQFSAFITNELKNFACGGNSQLPRFTFTAKTVDGALLGTFTGDIPQASSRQWNPYGFFFTSPAVPVPIVLDISIEARKGCGTVFSMDDITLRPCGPKLKATIGNSGATDVERCIGDPDPLILLATISSSMNDPVMNWQMSVDTGVTWKDIAGATSARYVVPEDGRFGVVLYRLSIAERANAGSPACRTVSNRIYANLNPRPVHHPPTPLVGCLEKDLLIQINTLASNYHWEGPRGFTQDGIDPVRLKDLQYQDSGLYVVSLVSDKGCASKDTFRLGVFPSTTIQTTTEYFLCEGQSVRLNAKGGKQFIWEPSSGLSSTNAPDPILTAKDSMVYKVLTINEYGCRDSAFVNVNVFRNPVAHAGHDLFIIRGDTVTLQGSANGTDIKSSWSPALDISDRGALTAAVHPMFETEYTLTVSSGVGCPTAIDRTMVKVYQELYIPNAFTPNGDGVNDVFRVITLDGYTLTRLRVFNRFGQVLFETSDPFGGWDGNKGIYEQPAGNYIYHVEWKMDNGQVRRKSGGFTLIR